MKIIKIAVIDSGIERTHPKFKDILNMQEHSFLDTKHNSDEDAIGGISGTEHGTGVFSIITNHLKSNLHAYFFYVIKIFDKRGCTSEDYLIKAIQYCIDNKIDIINLSMGIETDTPSEELRRVCDQLYNNNSILIAAASDNSVATFPAYFMNVYGVLGGIIESGKEYGVIEKGPIEFIGKGNLQRIASSNGASVFNSGNSLATAHITSIVAEIKRQNPEWDSNTIKKHLFLNGRKDIRLFSNQNMHFLDFTRNVNGRIGTSKKETEGILKNGIDFHKRFSWIKKIAIYPFSNKEMKAFQFFGDLCPFEVVELYDFPKFAAKLNNIRVQQTEIEVKWNVDEHSFDEVDTVVLGYPYSTAVELNVKFADKIIDLCIEKGKNFFVLDTLLYFELRNRVKNKDSVIYFPNDVGSVYNIAKTNILGKIKVPNITVVGITPQSGKFTTQLMVKKVLEGCGYSVGWLSTEPQGELFGADFCFPIGLEATELSLGNWPFLLNSLFRGIEDYKKPDIIISGHQSGFMPHNKDKFRIDTLRSINFLAASQPDSIICAVNPAYSLEQLDRVVTAIKTVFQLPILFFALSKRKIQAQQTRTKSLYLKNETLSDNEWLELAKIIEEKYNVPVIDPLNETHYKIVTASICNFFKA
jgi:hypothetical protein